MLQKME